MADLEQNENIITGLVRAGEEVYEDIAGKKLSASAHGISDKVAGFLDKIFPDIVAHLAFNLTGILTGLTAVLAGIALIITSAKRRQVTTS